MDLSDKTIRFYKDCEKCKGRGHHGSHTCGVCGGKGSITMQVKFDELNRALQEIVKAAVKQAKEPSLCQFGGEPRQLEEPMSEMFSDDVVLTCIFSHMEQVAVEDGKLKVLGRLGYPPLVKDSVEADFKIEVDQNTGHFRTLVDGPIRTDSHPIKYRIDVDALTVEEERDEDG